MNPKAADPRATIRYGRERLNRKTLALGIVAIVCGGFLVWLMQRTRFDVFETVMTWICLAVGVAVTGYELVMMVVPVKPLVAMSPRGLYFRIEWVKEILIPWRDVKGVETVDLVDASGATFLGVTVVLVTKEFYAHNIYVDDFFLRGPGWDNTFVPKGDLVQVALHHEILPATAEELRIAAETRWKAYGKAPTGTSVPAGGSD